MATRAVPVKVPAIRTAVVGPSPGPAFQPSGIPATSGRTPRQASLSGIGGAAELAASFDASKLPTLDPKDFQWGTPTAQQQQQLYQQFVQMAFMHASMMHPAAALMPGCCPPMFPMGCHPCPFPACPPAGFMPPPMAAVIVPPPASAPTQQAAPSLKKEQALKKDVTAKKERLRSVRPLFEASDDTVGISADQDRSMPSSSVAGIIDCDDDVQLSADELRMLFDDPLMLQDMDTCSVDEGSMGGSLASACTVDGLASLGRSPSAAMAATALTVDDVLLMADENVEEVSLHLGCLAAAFDDCVPMDQDTVPLRFPANATGLRSPRGRSRGVSAFAAVAAALSAPSPIPQAASVRVRGGVRKQRSGSGSTGRRSRSPAAFASPAPFEQLCDFGGLMGNRSSCRSSDDDWEASMSLDLDEAFCLPLDILD